MSTFKSALSSCGLSRPEAAEYLGVAEVTIDKWAQGRRTVPNGVWQMLADLLVRIQDAAEHAADLMVKEGIPPSAFENIEADLGPDPLPVGAARAAGATALLIALQEIGYD